MAALCPYCARARQSQQRVCPACGGSFSQYWVSVRCEFQCRGCGHRSPLNFLDTDGSVRCLHCGLEQVFSLESWRRALDFAHAVGDLSFYPEGRQPHPGISIAALNPYADVGNTRANAVQQQSGEVVENGLTIPLSLRVVAAPGHPRSAQTGRPVYVQPLPSGGLETRCDATQERRKYRAPLHPQLSRAVRALLAEEYRLDQPQVRLDRDPTGAVALKCPQCGAALSVPESARSATCNYCRTTCRIPDKLRYLALHTSPGTETWWILFEGPSPLRQALEQGTDADGKSVATAVERAPKRKRPAMVDQGLFLAAPSALLVVALVVLLVAAELLGIALIEY